jgi:hypothetical protein
LRVLGPPMRLHWDGALGAIQPLNASLTCWQPVLGLLALVAARAERSVKSEFELPTAASTCPFWMPRPARPGLASERFEPGRQGAQSPP